MTAGPTFRGRPLPWNPDRQAIEQERQRWVYERVSGMNELIRDLTTDPDREYEVHRDAYVETGDMQQLALALRYVRPEVAG